MFRKYKAAIGIKVGYLPSTISGFKGLGPALGWGGEDTQKRCLSREMHGASKPLSLTKSASKLSYLAKPFPGQ